MYGESKGAAAETENQKKRERERDKKGLLAIQPSLFLIFCLLFCLLLIPTKGSATHTSKGTLKYRQSWFTNDRLEFHIKLGGSRESRHLIATRRKHTRTREQHTWHWFFFFLLVIWTKKKDKNGQDKKWAFALNGLLDSTESRRRLAKRQLEGKKRTHSTAGPT